MDCGDLTENMAQLLIDISQTNCEILIGIKKLVEENKALSDRVEALEKASNGNT